MSHSNQDSKPRIEELLEALVRNTSHQLEAFDCAEFVRSGFRSVGVLLPCVPVLAIGAQCVRLALGYSASPILPWVLWIGLTLAVPIAWLIAKTLRTSFDVDRTRAIRAADSALRSSERLATADEFRQRTSQTGFTRAAMEDADTWAEKGQFVELAKGSSQSTPLPVWSAAVAACLLLAAGMLSTLSRSIGEPAASSSPLLADSNSSPSSEPEEPSAPTLTEEETEPDPEKEPLEKSPRNQRAINRQGTSGAAIPDSAEESSGKLSEGETRESQQSANPSNAKGSPSASGQPSKDEDEAKRKQKKPTKKPTDRDRKKKDRKEEEKPSGATAGQGSSKGSDNNAAPSDWASTSQSATPENEDVEDEEDVDDEEEEQESRGGIQPNMRDRRAPVNRDLQIGFGNNRPNPDANGRGGPGGQKKSRGVASLVLGVPIPDRVNGQPNKGRIRITQQRITPEQEKSDSVAAQDRLTRSNEPGLIFRPEATSKTNTEIKRYFLKRRADSSAESQSAESSTTTESQKVSAKL